MFSTFLMGVGSGLFVMVVKDFQLTVWGLGM